MEAKQDTDDYKPNDYTLERWLAALLALLFLIPWIANGQELPTTTLDKVEDAALLLKTGTPGVYAVAPNVSTDVAIRVTGPVVRTTVRQTFRNPTSRCVEGVYVFPLPEMRWRTDNPVCPSGRQDCLPSTSISVDLQPGYSLADVHSNYRLTQQTLGDEHYQLAIDDVPTDRDFELVWRPDLGNTPEAAVLTEKIGDQTFALVMITPPAQMAVAVPRETVFIIDSSGSMQGPSMEQAKQALLLAVDNLRSGDRFNIIDFDDQARPLFPESRPVDGTTLEVARQFVRDLDANGGTEMLNALQLALPATWRTDNLVCPDRQDCLSSTVRQVIFMTDGQVGNEQQLFTYIHKNLGDSRLFTVGIGSAPNSFGSSTFTSIEAGSRSSSPCGWSIQARRSSCADGSAAKRGHASCAYRRRWAMTPASPDCGRARRSSRRWTG